MRIGVRECWRLTLIGLVACAMVACGGGGGGNDSDNGSGNDTGTGVGTGTGNSIGNAGGSVPDGSGTGSAGAFTLSRTAVAFLTKRNGTPKLFVQAVTLHVTDVGSGAAKAIAGFKTGVTPPSWLTATATAFGADYSFRLTADITGLANGNYSTTLTFATTDANDVPLKTQDVPVSLIVRDGLVLASGAGLNISVVSGSSAQKTYSFPVVVSCPTDLQWKATSSESWIDGIVGTQHGPGMFGLTANTTGLSVGTHVATVTLTNIADTTDWVSFSVFVEIKPAALTVTGAPVTLGGTSGLESAAVPVRFKLNTDIVAHPWTLTTATASGGNWLHVSAANGSVSGSDATVNVDAIGAQLDAGVYSGSIEVRATVNGDIVKQTIPVTLNFEANRLLVSATGVAFSSFPARQVLTRKLRVFNTRDGVTGKPWTAVSDQSWLAVTGSGVTGDSLVLTAARGALAPGQYFATVTISSPDTSIVNQQAVRVGFTIGNTDPTAVIDIPAEQSKNIVASPVEPAVFALAPASVKVYDTNSGALLRTLSGSFVNAASMTISDDGTTLYVAEPASNGANIIALNAGTGAIVGHYSFGNTFGSISPSLHYTRPDANPVLVVTPGLHAFDLASGTSYLQGSSGLAVSISADQRTVYMGIGASIFAYRTRFSTLAGKGFLLNEVAENDGNSDSRENGQDLALSPDETELYVAAGAPYRFDVLDSATLARRRFINLPASSIPVGFPTNVEICWNKLIAGGAYAPGYGYSPKIYIFDVAGNLLALLDSGSGILFPRTLHFSGDGSRILAGSEGGLRIQDAPTPP